MNFQELLQQCLSCATGKMTKTAFRNIVETSFKVRKYVPLQGKMGIADFCKNLWETQIGNTEEQQLLNVIDSSVPHKPYDYQNTMLMYMWIKTCVLICMYFDIDYEYAEPNSVFYDSFVESGLINYLNEVTEGDFKEFDKYVDWFSGITYYPLLDVIKKTIMNLPSKEQLKEAMEQISQSKEAMDNVKQIINFINTETDKVDKK